MCGTFTEFSRCSCCWVCSTSSSILPIHPKFFQFFSGFDQTVENYDRIFKCHKVLKFLSETRWFARGDAFNALHNGYDHISEALA